MHKKIKLDSNIQKKGLILKEKKFRSYSFFKLLSIDVNIMIMLILGWLGENSLTAGINQVDICPIQVGLFLSENNCGRQNKAKLRQGLKTCHL